MYCFLFSEASHLKIVQGPLRNEKTDAFSSGLKCTLPIAEIEEEDTWDFNRNRWSRKRSKLCAYEWYSYENILFTVHLFRLIFNF